MKCKNPDCNNELPEWRERDGNITCSKSCAMAWNHIPSKEREKIRGKKYGKSK